MSMSQPEPKVALCYVRLSVTKNQSDMTSPERQRANIERACQENGWIPEWYEDAKGHKSATSEQNRPEWQKLKQRFKDPDVAALVVNDLSRAMRNLWRVSKLFEDLPNYGVILYLASTSRRIDISTTDGRLSAYLTAIMDDLFAVDASKRAKDSVQYRKSRGVSIGIPPFGTVRGNDNYLMPTPQGAWLLPDGTFQHADNNSTPPHSDAIWRGYYDCAKRALEIYATNMHGYHRIAEILMETGWCFRDRYNQPREVNGDDVRRIITNWREYAGFVSKGRARERQVYNLENIAETIHQNERAVFDVNLLKAVAEIQEARSICTRPPGAPANAYPFALSGILYCATCDAHAQRENDPSLQSRINGWNKRGELRYRHTNSKSCTCKRKSLPVNQIEDEFGRLIRLLAVRPEAVEKMSNIALSLEYQQAEDTLSEEERLAKKAKALKQHRNALKNSLAAYTNGEIDTGEYQRLKDYHSREIVHWESMTTERQKVTMQLVVAIEALKLADDLWSISEGEDRQLLVRSLFDKVVYDLDKQQIVDFKMKEWAEPFIILRTALYNEENDDDDNNGGDDNDGIGGGIPRDSGGNDGGGNTPITGKPKREKGAKNKKSSSKEELYFDPNGLPAVA